MPHKKFSPRLVVEKIKRGEIYRRKVLTDTRLLFLPRGQVVGLGAAVAQIYGDFLQNDLNSKRAVICIGWLMDSIDRINSFSSIEMQTQDIVRSGLVKEWILARG